jgi:hypothetical protein
MWFCCAKILQDQKMSIVVVHAVPKIYKFLAPINELSRPRLRKIIVFRQGYAKFCLNENILYRLYATSPAYVRPCPCRCQESNLVRPVRYLLAILTELPEFPKADTMLWNRKDQGLQYISFTINTKIGPYTFWFISTKFCAKGVIFSSWLRRFVVQSWGVSQFSLGMCWRKIWKYLSNRRQFVNVHRIPIIKVSISPEHKIVVF